MRTFKSIAPFLAVIVAVSAWLFFSEIGAKTVARWLQPWRAAGPEVGRVSEMEGSFKTVRDGRVEEYTSLKNPLPLHSGDRIEVDAESRAVVILNSQDEIQLGPLTAAALQLWNERDPGSAIYLNLLSGTSELRRAGVKGKAYIVRDGRLYLPGQKPLNKAMALTVLKSAPLDMQLADEGIAENPSNTSPDFAAPDAETALIDESPTKGFGAEPQTLSNEFIDEIITQKQSLLQKCWLARVKENPNLKASMVVQFDITRRGKVKDVKIADSSAKDEILHKCVSTVFERLAFRSFKGSEISLSYPIQFE